MLTSHLTSVQLSSSEDLSLQYQQTNLPPRVIRVNKSSPVTKMGRRQVLKRVS